MITNHQVLPSVFYLRPMGKMYQIVLHQHPIKTVEITQTRLFFISHFTKPRGKEISLKVQVPPRNIGTTFIHDRPSQPKIGF